MEPGILERSHLMRRLASPAVSVVTLYAPAGYGKSVIAAQIAGEDAPTCDCTGLETPEEFAGRVVRALAAGDPTDLNAIPALAVTRRENAHADDALSALFNLWQITDGEPWFVFENAEHLAARPALIPLLERLVARRGSRRIVICSRVPLPARLGRTRSSLDVVSFWANDLAFTEAETVELTRDAGGDDADGAALYAITAGWPILTQALKRAVPSGLDRVSIETAIASSASDATRYLAEEVIAQSSDADIAILAACAAIPSASARDIERALGPEARAPLARLAHESPFLSKKHDGTHAVHPILREALLEHRGAACADILVRAAVAARDSNDVERAADLFLAAGDDVAAAAVFDGYPTLFSATPTPAMLATIARIGNEELLRHPRLWAMVSAHSCFAVDPTAWMSEIRYVWRHVRDGNAIAAKISIALLVATVAPFYGSYDDAFAALDDISRFVPEGSPAAAALATRNAALRAQLGAHDEARAWWAAAEAQASVVDMTFALVSYDVLARIARVDGDRAAEVRALQDALHATKRMGIALFEGSALADAAFGAWLAGESERYELRSTALRRYLTTPIARGFEHLLDCIDGFPRRARTGCEPPKFRVWGYLIACGDSNDREEALWCAERALAAAEEARQPYYEALAAIALAFFAPDRKRELLARTVALSARIHSEPFADAVARIERGEPKAGTLEPFVARLREVPGAAVAQLSVGILRGEVRIGAEIVLLAQRELEVVILLASARRPQPARRLAEALYPDRSVADAANALKVTINRVRGKLGRETLLSTRDGYLLAHDGHDDFLEIEAMLAAVQADCWAPGLRAGAQSLLVRVESAGADFADSWEWYEPLRRVAADSLRALRVALAQRDLRDGSFDRAVAGARALIACDPCDEEARELLIRALVENGDQTGAMREYRDYRNTLARELDAAPGEHLLRLIREEPVSRIRRAAQR